MEAKEKATELIIRFQYLTLDLKKAIDCALICVDEIIEDYKKVSSYYNEYGGDYRWWYEDYINDGILKYWNDVKEEISKLK